MKHYVFAKSTPRSEQEKERMSREKAIFAIQKSSTVVSQLANPVQHQVNNFLPDGIVP